MREVYYEVGANLSKSSSSQIDDSRSVRISQFRNIAPRKDSKEILILNRGLRFDDDVKELGGLVIIVGGNNCGKSNVLDAVEMSKTLDFGPDDKTNLILNPPEPQIKISKIQTTASEGVATVSVSKKTEVMEGTVLDATFLLIKQNESYEAFKRKYPDKADISASEYLSEMEKLFDNYYDPQTTTFSKKGVIKTILDARADSLDSSIQSIKNKFTKDSVDSVRSEIIEMPKVGTILERSETSSKKATSTEYPGNVFRYEYFNISDKDLECDFDNLSPFIEKILSLLGYSAEDMKQIYSNNWNREIEDEINAKLEDKVEEFNKLFNNQSKKYSMSMRLNRPKLIEFDLTTDDGILLPLKTQSQGFKWVFNFYMQLALSNYSPGDVIVIDEFGNSLNFGTIKELGDILRDVAKRQGLTFVLATQNPIVINTDYLDEVRLVVPLPKKGGCKIVNNFDEFCKYSKNSNGHDIMGPILNGMTIGRNYLRTENRRTIFVESTEDYFYLTSMARYLKRNGQLNADVDFLPINGIGSDNEDPEQIVKTICSIEPHRAILFISSDSSNERANQIKEMCEAWDVLYKPISDVLKGKNSIRDLFEEADKAVYESNCSFDKLACFSHNVDYYASNFDNATIDNFKQLILNLK